MPKKYIKRRSFDEHLKLSRGADDECWNWSGGLMVSGYGMIAINNKKFLAHRLTYELLVGPIPEGLQIDHLCRNRRCVNPGHMEPVTPAVNKARGESLAARNLRKTHCIHGHLFDEANTKIRTVSDGRTTRVCKACHRKRVNDKKKEKRRLRRLELMCPKESSPAGPSTA